MPDKPSHSGRKKLLFATIIIVGIPALFVGLLELGLRLAGFGYPTDFFVRKTVEGEDFYYTNHRFTFPYFPQALARSVIPHRLSVTKPADSYRIFIFGESAANGDPDPAYGFGRHLEILLEDRYPGTDFEVVCTAITAVNSHVILPIARECAQKEGDLWIVYMGNNEVIGPYGAGTIFGAKAPPLPVVRASLAVKRTRLGQLTKSVLENLQGNAGEAPTWEGINMFADNLLRADDPARLQVYENFRGNLEDILAAGREAGVPVLLSTVASNLEDCAPFASLHGKGLTAAQLADWNRLYETGKALEAEGAHAEALEAYTGAAAIDPGYAELAFRIGRGEAALGNSAAALEAFTNARDADALMVRTDSRINAIIREAAVRSPGGNVHLVEADKELATESPDGLPGREVFYEHVHFNLLGNYHLARIFAGRIAEILPPRIRDSDTQAWAGPGFCQRKLAVTLWDQVRLWTEMRERQAAPPFSARADNAANLAWCEAQASAAHARMDARLDRMIYELVLKEDPEDYHLHFRFGHFLQLNGDLPGAARQFEWVGERFPDFEGGHQQLGLTLFLQGRLPEARARFQRVLEINPHYTKAAKALELIDQPPP